MKENWSAIKKLIWQHGLSGGSALPDGYRRVRGFAFDGNTYYRITDLKLTGDDTVRFSVAAAAACNVFGCYTNTSAANNYSLYISTTSGSKYLRYNGSTYKSYWSSAALGERYDISITPTGSSGMPSGQDDTWERADFTASVDMCIGTTSTGATSAKFKGDLYGAFDVAGRFHGIPCERESDNVLGYYDTFSGFFFEPTGAEPVSLGYDG